jgi:hypothetical protein
MNDSKIRRVMINANITSIYMLLLFYVFKKSFEINFSTFYLNFLNVTNNRQHDELI